MPEPAPPSPCPIVAKLVAMLLERSSSPREHDDRSVYLRLIDLEAEARRVGVPDDTCRLLARVRRIAGSATIIAFPPRFATGRSADCRLR